MTSLSSARLHLSSAKLDCGDCGRTASNCDRRDSLRTPKDTVCRGPAARRALAAKES